MSPFFRRKKAGSEYYFERGEECLKREDYRWALESFTKAIEFNPGFEMAYYKRAEVYKKLGETRKALEDYVMFLETDRRSYETAEGLKDVLPAVWKNAQLEVQRGKARDEIRSYGIVNIVKELMEEYNPGKEYLSRNLYGFLLSELKKGSLKQRKYIGFVQLLRENLGKAVEEFDDVIKENPRDPDLYYFRGVALLKKMEELREKGFVARRNERVKETQEKAYSSFMQALKAGFCGGLCPECGYRTRNPELSFCMYCGKKLLTARRSKPESMKN